YCFVRSPKNGARCRRLRTTDDGPRTKAAAHGFWAGVAARSGGHADLGRVHYWHAGLYESGASSREGAPGRPAERRVQSRRDSLRAALWRATISRLKDDDVAPGATRGTTATPPAE